MNSYIGLYKGKKKECYSDTSYHAQQILAKDFNAKNMYDVTVIIAEQEGKPVIHSGEEL